jgi:hypothetical protein
VLHKLFERAHDESLLCNFPGACCVGLYINGFRTGLQSHRISLTMTMLSRIYLSG